MLSRLLTILLPLGSYYVAAQRQLGSDIGDRQTVQDVNSGSACPRSRLGVSVAGRA